MTAPRDSAGDLPALDSDARSALISIARNAIEEEFGKRRASGSAGVPEARLGAFVTLKIGGALRGCIGRMTSGDPLPRTIRDMAKAAAFEDPRFPPLDHGEFPLVSVEITVLTPPRRIASPDMVQVGKHGLLITRGWHSGVLLPQVAVEYGWNREEFLDQTCRKAGLPPDAWRAGDCEISVFEGLVFSGP